MIQDPVYFFSVIALIAIPVYMSNGLALVFGGKTPLDFGAKFTDGRPLFGGGKTFKGTIAGIISGTIGAAAVVGAAPEFAAAIGANYLFYGFLLAAGAMLGDIAGSFVKRRMNVKRGKSVFPLDQLDFIIGGIALGLITFAPTVLQLAVLAIATLSMHKLGNIIAFKTRIKNVPW